MTIQKWITTLIPMLIGIGSFEVITMLLYQNSTLYQTPLSLYLWQGALILGSLLFGYISDKHCRKKMYILTHVLGILSMLLAYIYKYPIWTIYLFALTYKPLVIARAALIDNFPFISKVKLIALCFIIVFLPWCFYGYFQIKNNHLAMIIMISILFFNGLFTFFFFNDQRDISIRKNKNHLHPLKNKKIIFTCIAFLSAQIVFYISDIYIETFTHNKFILASLGIGITIGLLFSIFYTKIPHISLLTMFYGFGVILALLPLLTTFFMPISDINIPYQIMIFASITGFYLPFVYDIIFSNIKVQRRGFVSGFLDSFISLAAIIGATIYISIQYQEKVILSVGALLFFIAMVTQKISEKSHEENA